mmetsp:Transcript_27136/g.68979  ORF Transcript_27136/g.68979 Transcript_27136/m.68979 type:complete len:108 (-) Transcript_27136:361-684(-)
MFPALSIAAMAMATGLKPQTEFTSQYRARWARGPISSSSNILSRTKLYDPNPLGLDEAEPSELCVSILDKTGFENNVCGEASFDSTDDGMVCIEDVTKDGSLKWVCN